MKYFKLVSLFIISLSLISCVAKEDEALFQKSKELTLKNKPVAFKNLEQLCVKYPKDKRFCSEADKLKSEIYSDNISYAKEVLGRDGYLPLGDIKRAKKGLLVAKKYTTNKSEADSMIDRLAAERVKTVKIIESVEAGIEPLLAEGKHIEAYRYVKQIEPLDPYRINRLASIISNKARIDMMVTVEKLVTNEDWYEAKKILSSLAEIRPKDKLVNFYLELSRKNDNPAYYINKGEVAEKSDDFQLAISMYKKAIRFPKFRHQVQERITSLRIKLADEYFSKGVEAIEILDYKVTNDNLVLAFDMMKQMPVKAQLKVRNYSRIVNAYYADLFLMGEKSLPDYPGRALVYFLLLERLKPDYAGLQVLISDNKRRLYEAGVGMRAEDIAKDAFVHEFKKRFPDAIESYATAMVKSEEAERVEMFWEAVNLLNNIR